MLSPTFIFSRDFRMGEEAKKAFPQSPVLAEYLSMRLCKNHGSLAVLRIMIEELKSAVPDPHPVTVDAFARLAVEDVQRYVTIVAKALNEAGIDTCDRKKILIFRLGYVEESADVKGEVGHDLIAYPSIDLDFLSSFLCIFTCALAMLKGLEIDPKAMAA